MGERTDCRNCGGDGYTTNDPKCPACKGTGKEMQMNIVKQIENRRTAEYHSSLLRALTKTNGNVLATARELGVSKQWVRRWSERFGIDIASYRIPKRKFSVVLQGKLIGEVMDLDEVRAQAQAVQRFGIGRSELPYLVVFEPKEEK